jgi:AsmA-like C-terminal region
LIYWILRFLRIFDKKDAGSRGHFSPGFLGRRPDLPSASTVLKRLQGLWVSVQRALSHSTEGVFSRSVKRISRITLLVIVGVAGLVGLGLLAINLYVQSPGTQVRLREIVSENLGYPVSVFRISFTPWNGLHLENVVIQDPSANYPLLKAEDLWIQCNYLPLLRRKLIVRQVYLSGAEIRIPTTARLDPEAAPEKPAAPESVTESGSKSVSPSIAKSDPTGSRSKKTVLAENHIPGNLWVEIRKFKIRHGTIYLLGAKGIPTATLRDIEGSVQSHKSEYLGKVRIASAALADSINAEEISSPVKCSNGALSLENITAQISGGEIHGNFRADLTNSDLPYRLYFEMTGVNINEIVSRAGGILDRAHGILQGSFQLAGCMRDPSLASGDGSLEIKTAYLDQYPMLKALGRWTQIDELQRLDLERALSKFSVVGQDIKVDSVQLISKNCQVVLWGTVQSAQKLDLNGRLTVSQFLSQKIPNELEENFAKSKDGESRYLDFQITGSVLKPQTDLVERIIGDKAKLLKKLFRTDHKEKRHERIPAGSEQAGTPSDG